MELFLVRTVMHAFGAKPGSATRNVNLNDCFDSNEECSREKSMDDWDSRWHWGWRLRQGHKSLKHMYSWSGC